MFKKILIANRGEIACRVIRTCRRLGIATVAVYSDADASAQHVRLADEAYAIGGPRPAQSYLRGDAIIDVAKRSGAEAIHPGYGFLSENPAFARAIKTAGLSFIGPTPESMEQMGSKAGAKALMITHDVPTVPGYHGENQDTAFLREQARTTGFPLMIKATAGGGGKGMRIVHDDEEFVAALQSAQREAQSSFDDQRVILERYVEHPRHIEFQVFGDSLGNVIHLNERECSAQRRYQKVLEETPSPFLNAARRQAMGEAAIAAARAVNYLGAGTIEFIVAPDGSFFFMEMNTRLQVEHPVTELTLGLDLVEWQLRIAAGEPLPLQQAQIHAHGHAIELRVYAEDPEQNFLPDSGKLEQLCLPVPSPQVRIDSGVIEGDSVSIFYDPMITKLIVWDNTRDLALMRLREALAASEIVGPKSNIAFLEKLVRHPIVVEGRIDTGYLDRHLDEFLPQQQTPDSDILFAAATAALLYEEVASAKQAAMHTDPHSPWHHADAWRIAHAGKRIVAFTWRDERIEIAAHGSEGNYALSYNEQPCEVRNALLQQGWLSATYNGTARRLRSIVSDQRVMIHDATTRYVLQHIGAYAYVASAQKVSDRIAAPMPGRIVLVKVKNGDQVVENQELLVMEAMKMEITLRAPRAATIDTVQTQAGEFVEADSVLIKLAQE